MFLLYNYESPPVRGHYFAFKKSIFLILYKEMSEVFSEYSHEYHPPHNILFLIVKYDVM